MTGAGRGSAMTRGFTGMLRLAPEVERALIRGLPVVALETSLVAHGLPHPTGLEAALACEQCVSRAEPTRLQQAAVSQPSDVAGPQSARLYLDVTVPTVDPPLPAPAERAPEADQPAIRIFTARPGSIAASGGAGLCYAIEGASRARIGPGVGEVIPSSTLTVFASGRLARPRTSLPRQAVMVSRFDSSWSSW